MPSSRTSLRKPRLVRDVGLALACKIAVIFALWLLFFSPSHRPDASSDSVARAVLGSAPAQAVQSIPSPANQGTTP